MSPKRFSTIAAVLLLLSAAACVDQPTSPGQQTVLQASRVPGPGIREVQERYTPGLLRHAGIIGTGIRVGQNGDESLVVYAVTPADAAAAHIPDQLEGFGVHTVATGLIIATDYNDPTTHERPAPNGFSVGHYAITAGTIGARVMKSDGSVFILSNNHVLANANRGSIGDPIYQPGPYDGGTAADQIGTLADYQYIDMSFSGSNTIDAAIAAVDPDDVLGATPSYAYGVPGTTVVPASVGLAVKKFGRTTALTHGSVAEVNVFIEVCYTVILGRFCIESAYFFGQMGISPGTFSGGGDSGSLIVTDDAANNPVGLLFAGSSERTFANPIGAALSRFGVTIDPGTGSPPPPPPPPPGDAVDPIAAFTYSCSKSVCSFTDESSDNVGVTEWAWDFGDGKGSTVQNPVHTFGEGNWLVALTASDDAGNSDMASRTLTCAAKGKNIRCK